MRRQDKTVGHEVATPLGVRERLILFQGTKCSAESAAGFEDSHITIRLMLESGCSASNILAAGIYPMELSRRGATTAVAFKSAGFDALDMSDPAFAAQIIAVAGAKSVRELFVLDSSDAVCIAGTDAADSLSLTSSVLLQLCAGAPVEAQNVISQMARASSQQTHVLHGVTVQTLLDTGMRANALKTCGINVVSIARETNATTDELVKLGFSPTLLPAATVRPNERRK